MIYMVIRDGRNKLLSADCCFKHLPLFNTFKSFHFFLYMLILLMLSKAHIQF